MKNNLVAIRRYYCLETEHEIEGETFNDVQRYIYDNNLVSNEDVNKEIIKDLNSMLENGEMLDHNIYLKGLVKYKKIKGLESTWNEFKKLQ